MSEGGFNLRKWNSNSSELLSKIASFAGTLASDLATCKDSNGGEGVSSYFIDGGNSQAGEQCKLLVSTNQFTFCFAELIDLISKLTSGQRSLLKVTASILILTP